MGVNTVAFNRRESIDKVRQVPNGASVCMRCDRSLTAIRRVVSLDGRQVTFKRTQ